MKLGRGLRAWLSAAPWEYLRGRTFALRTYGCQMNRSDSEVATAVLLAAGLAEAPVEEADVVLLNTCAVRENAEQRVCARVTQLAAGRRPRPLIGVLGCMAERLKDRLVEQLKAVDLVAGPDAYRDLPRLLNFLLSPQNELRSSFAINTALSLEETYAEIVPVRRGATAALLTIMRGCNNRCSFCIVPFVRGAERSRPMGSVLVELRELRAQGVREVTLLGQNVNSYLDATEEGAVAAPAPGFRDVRRGRAGTRGADFAALLERCAREVPDVRIRFTSPHPKDFAPRVLEVLAAHPSLARSLHVPMQSGSDAVLSRMNRLYTAESFRGLVRDIRAALPGVSLTTDVLVGFCGESEEEFEQTRALYAEVGFDAGFCFAYSERERTQAQRQLVDDVPAEVKNRRLQQMIELATQLTAARCREQVGARHLVLIDREEVYRGELQFKGTTDTSKRTVVRCLPAEGQKLGVWVEAEVVDVHGHTLIAEFKALSSIAEFSVRSGGLPFYRIIGDNSKSSIKTDLSNE